MFLVSYLVRCVGVPIYTMPYISPLPSPPLPPPKKKKKKKKQEYSLVIMMNMSREFIA